MTERVTLEQKIEDRLGISDEVSNEVTVSEGNFEVINPEPEVDQEAKEDYEMVRTNIKELAQISIDAVKNYKDVAKETESPRANEVLSTMLKTATDINIELLDVHQKKMLLLAEEEVSKGGDTHIDKAVFVGSTKEMFELMRKEEEENE